MHWRALRRALPTASCSNQLYEYLFHVTPLQSPTTTLSHKEKSVMIRTTFGARERTARRNESKFTQCERVRTHHEVTDLKENDSARKRSAHGRPGLLGIPTGDQTKGYNDRLLTSRTIPCTAPEPTREAGANGPLARRTAGTHKEDRYKPRVQVPRAPQRREPNESPAFAPLRRAMAAQRLQNGFVHGVL
jgi:hypothetical protein